MSTPAQVGIIMGSDSDLPIMQAAADTLKTFNIPFELTVVSAHRTPARMVDYAAKAKARGLKVIIAGAGGAAHLPGMLASKTIVPIWGVPVPSKYLRGEDSLYSIVQMPKGVPVASFAIGEAGAANAALHIVAMFASADKNLAKRLHDYRAKQTQAAQAMQLP